MKKILPLVSLLCLLVALAPLPAQGAVVNLNETYCQETLQGIWTVGSVCNIQAGSIGTVPAGDTLQVLDVQKIALGGGAP